MTNIAVNKKDEIVMKIIHYFVTEEDYKPIIVHGVQNEIWLENLDNDVSLIRININYIHNSEQYYVDTRKCEAIRKTIKKKTFSLKMSVLNILLDVRDDVNIENDKYIETIKVERINDLKNDSFINEWFPGLKEKISTKKGGVESMVMLSEELNNKTVKEDKKMAKIFNSKEKPVITYALIVINVIMFIISLLNYSGVINLFANYYVNVKMGEVYRLLTCTFVHANAIHLFFNMYALYQIGPLCEKYYGKGKYLLIYLGSGIIGSLFSCVLCDYVSIGASGAIFGLFGALLFFSYKYRATMDSFLRSGIIPVILLNLILGFMVENIDVFGHIGGLIGGLSLSYTLGVYNKFDRKERLNGLIVTCLFIIMLVLMLIKK